MRPSVEADLQEPTAAPTRPPRLRPTVRSPLSLALDDFARSLARWRVAFWLGWQDAILPFRRTFIGPMWIAVQTGLWALIIIAFLGPSLGAGAPAYPVYVCAGVVFFQFLTNFLVDGSAAFTKNVALIQNIPNPVSLYLLRAAAKSVILLVAQAPVVAAGLLYTGASPQWVWLLAAPNILLLTIVMSGMALTLASVTPQFRDIPFALNAAMRVMFFVTPVIWLVEQRGGVRALAAQYNPFAHFIALARDPFMGAAPPLQSVLVTLFAGLVSWSLGLALFARNRARIASQL